MTNYDEAFPGAAFLHVHPASAAPRAAAAAVSSEKVEIV